MVTFTTMQRDHIKLHTWSHVRSTDETTYFVLSTLIRGMHKIICLPSQDRSVQSEMAFSEVLWKGFLHWMEDLLGYPIVLAYVLFYLL